MVSFRNFVILPLCVVSAFLSINLRIPSDIACIVKAAVQNFKNEYGELPDFNKTNHKQGLICILSFLWCSEKKLLDPLPFSITSNEVVSKWSYRVHTESILNTASHSSGDTTTTPTINPIL